MSCISELFGKDVERATSKAFWILRRLSRNQRQRLKEKASSPEWTQAIDRDLNTHTQGPRAGSVSVRLQTDLTLPWNPYSLKTNIPGPGIYNLGPVDYFNLP